MDKWNKVGQSLSLYMAYKTYATLEGPTWNSRALPFFLFSLAVFFLFFLSFFSTTPDADPQMPNGGEGSLPRTCWLRHCQYSPECRGRLCRRAHCWLTLNLMNAWAPWIFPEEQLLSSWLPPCAAPCCYSMPAARFCISLCWTSRGPLLLVSLACRVPPPNPPLQQINWFPKERWS